MGYKLAASNGDTLAVPQLVLTHLTQTDGDTIRAALYILQTHDTDPRTMARALALPSIEAAKRTLQYWAASAPKVPCPSGPVPGCWSVSAGPPLPRQPSPRGSIWPAWPTTPMLPFCARRRKASSAKR